VPTGRYIRSRRAPITPLSLAEFRDLIETWLGDGEIAGHSPRTLANRRLITRHLLWWLAREGHAEVGEPEMRGFFLYLRHGHEEPGGRWEKGEREPLRPASAKWWHAYLSSLWAAIERQGAVEESPMLRLPAPRVPRDQVQPLTEEQVAALLEATRSSRYCRRDFAIVLFLFDTGVRAAELCGIRTEDVQLPARRVEVLGKGNKRRTVCFGVECARALWSYLRARPRGEGDPLFIAEGGGALTPSGLKRCIQKLGRRAGITGARVSPHTLRHAFSLAYVRAGADAFRLQQALGHTTLEMSRKYVAMGEADLVGAHRSFSPGDALRHGR
jgi:integrase/recombinase XerC